MSATPIIGKLERMQQPASPPKTNARRQNFGAIVGGVSGGRTRSSWWQIVRRFGRKKTPAEQQGDTQQRPGGFESLFGTTPRETVPPVGGVTTQPSKIHPPDRLTEMAGRPFPRPLGAKAFEPSRLAFLHDAATSDVSFIKDCARAQCFASEGAFADADRILADALTAHAASRRTSDHVFSCLLAASLTCQRLDLVAGLLEEREDCAFEAGFAADLPNGMAIGVTIRQNRTCVILFDASCVGGTHADRLIGSLLGATPLLAVYAKDPAMPYGASLFSLADVAAHPGLGFCSADTSVRLVPDPYFVTSRGYEGLRRQFEANPVKWSDRLPVAFWRGSTTGIRIRPDRNWSGLQRIELCRLSLKEPGPIDAFISKVVQAANDEEAAEIERAGLLRPGVPPESFLAYRYQIDIDGNSNSWPGLYMKLLTGSPVLKIASPREFRQWYYDRLIPWTNFVPVKADLSDFEAQLQTLRQQDERARAIGDAGRALALSLDYNSEVGKAKNAIDAAIDAAKSTAPRFRRIA